jgi:hypothetical protein
MTPEIAITPLSHYPYDPSIHLAIIFGVLYSITFFITLYQWIRYKAGVWAIMVFAATSTIFTYLILPFLSPTNTHSGINRLHRARHLHATCLQ